MKRRDLLKTGPMALVGLLLPTERSDAAVCTHPTTAPATTVPDPATGAPTVTHYPHGLVRTDPATNTTWRFCGHCGTFVPHPVNSSTREGDGGRYALEIRKPDGTIVWLEP